MNERIFSESIKKFPFTQKKLFRPAVFSQGIVTTSHSAPHVIPGEVPSAARDLS